MNNLTKQINQKVQAHLKERLVQLQEQEEFEDEYRNEVQATNLLEYLYGIKERVK